MCSIVETNPMTSTTFVLREWPYVSVFLIMSMKTGVLRLLSLCGKASGKGVEIRMWGNGLQKLRFQFPVASQSKGPPPIGWFRWSVFQQGRGESQM